MYLLFVILAGFLDVLANLLLKKSQGFKYKILGIVSILLVLCAFIFLSFALKKMPLSIAYSIWGAVGIIGTIIGGYIFFQERLNIIGYIGVAFVIASVILLSAF
ncbi:DMT family transporter [Helicobacter cappadocius]|uniref:Spermidine export protein MdtI n=1 Tax=Helicobacter cappadocius TaxID=3063998 RepID=A0AA90TF92_9HELI|nr:MULTISPECIES: SMR family transporter [unclassified Helicobacter]MDO7253463.1 SMR family transporter [Helicobacter sp. faydin-H75]MDP2539390.1 SMR family transporter [Helicobacter sp. faydin-H76]